MSKLRVLPLGGLGEIGKNMTVVEYEDRIVVVDTGLRFPTADMLGIDLVLPDFTYLRERADDVEAIIITHGHEDHLGALPWVLRELGSAGVMPPARSRAITEPDRAGRRPTAAASPAMPSPPSRRRAPVPFPGWSCKPTATTAPACSITLPT